MQQALYFLLHGGLGPVITTAVAETEGAREAQFVVVAETREAALAAARPAYLKWHESFHYLWRLHGRTAQISGVVVANAMS